MTELIDSYAAWLKDTGRGSASYVNAAWAFMARWPDADSFAAEPLPVRLRAPNSSMRPFMTFLMLHGRLRPGFDYLAHRKVQALTDLAATSPLAADLARFDQAADELGFSAHQRRRLAHRVLLSLLINTGRPLEELDEGDLGDLEKAFQQRADTRGGDWGNDRTMLFGARTVLFHLGIITEAPASRLLGTPQRYAARFTGVPAPLTASFLAYLQRLTATHAASSISGFATYLAHFGRFLATVDDPPGSLADLDRRRHIEPFLAATGAARRRDGLPVSVGERRNRIIAVSRFLADIAEWDWPEAPHRRLLFTRDIPRRPRPLPRYLTPDADRVLTQTLNASPRRLIADGLLLMRATGLRIGELLDLELDCVHEIGGQGAWLKVPLGKLDTERMVPLDDDTVAIIDRIADTRSPGRPLPHPRTGRPCDFLFTHHGKRLSQAALRDELARAADIAGISHTTPHALRHTYATALVNSGVSLQALMALLGHTSAAMSLRYGRLFDDTMREHYERALTQARARVGPILPTPSTPVALHTDWRDASAIKARLAGGFCVRAQAQGPCPYANICEHCPNFRTDTGYLPVLATQRADTETLAADAHARGWGEEAARHQRLLERLDALIASTQAG